MKLKTFFETAIKRGMEQDPRGPADVKNSLKAAGTEYKKCKGADKSAFDKGSLKNPYADSRMLSGDEDLNVKHIMAGIDIGVSELLLADRLREKGVKIDLVVSHHPSGRSFAELHKVMSIQTDLWRKYGLEKEVAEGLMGERIGEVSRGVSSANHSREMDAAKLLGIPFMCLHTPADNCVTSFLQRIFDKTKPATLKSVVAQLKGISEYRRAMDMGAGPYILVGDEKKKAGKIFVDMTGGTSGPSKLFARISQAGVKTIVGMHCKEESYKIAKGEFINYVIAGHISSDTLGLNLLFDAVEKKEKMNFIECSGFKRIRRKI